MLAQPGLQFSDSDALHDYKIVTSGHVFKRSRWRASQRTKDWGERASVLPRSEPQCPLHGLASAGQGGRVGPQPDAELEQRLLEEHLAAVKRRDTASSGFTQQARLLAPPVNQVVNEPSPDGFGRKRKLLRILDSGGRGIDKDLVGDLRELVPPDRLRAGLVRQILRALRRAVADQDPRPFACEAVGERARR